MKDKLVTVFPTYGYRDDNGWTVPVRVWVHKARRVDHITDADIRALLSDDQGGPAPTDEEVIRCRTCVADFIADSDSHEHVVLIDDHGQELFEFPSRTDANGLVEGKLRLPAGRSGRITLTARVREHGQTFEGRGIATLLEPKGKSVVSDIDDTIKVTEIPAGKGIVLRNTFLRSFVAAEGMRDRYVGFGDVSFHYVSGSPWQLFGLLHAFLIDEAKFPPGTFHMKSLRTSVLDLPALLSDLRNLVTGSTATKAQKISQISELIKHLEGRTFTLIGDSGELDPEVFTELREKYGKRVEKIVIRDVAGARQRAPERLKGVDEVIETPMIQRGVSQFTVTG